MRKYRPTFGIPSIIADREIAGKLYMKNDVKSISMQVSDNGNTLFLPSITNFFRFSASFL